MFRNVLFVAVAVGFFFIGGVVGFQYGRHVSNELFIPVQEKYERDLDAAKQLIHSLQAERDSAADDKSQK